MTWQALEEHMQDIQNRNAANEPPPLCIEEVVLVLHDEWDWTQERITAALKTDNKRVGRILSEHYEARARAAGRDSWVIASRRPGYMKVYRPAA